MESDSDIQLEILSSSAQSASPRVVENPINIRSIIPIFLLSLLSVIIHIFFQNFNIQDLGIFLSIIMQISTDILKHKPNSSNFSFGFSRLPPINSIFSYILLLILMFTDIYFILVLNIEDIPAALILLSIFIYAIQFTLVYSEPLRLIKVFLLWGIINHLLGFRKSLMKHVVVLAQVFFFGYAGFNIVKEDFKEIMEFTPADQDIDSLFSAINTVNGVEDIHDFHSWKIGEQVYVSFHVVSFDLEILRVIKRICRFYPRIYTIVQVEDLNFKCKSYKIH